MPHSQPREASRRYFDHNATTPPHESTVAAVVEAMQRHWGNPHAQHQSGQDAAVALDQARHRLAAVLGLPVKGLTFTSGASEGNAWVLRRGGVGSGPAVCSAIEHPSVLASSQETLPVDGLGQLDLDALRARLRAHPPPRLVSVMAANNETGVLQDIVSIAALCRDHGVPFHTDATQLPGRLPLDALQAADIVTLSAHKLGGPRGTGLVSSRTPLAPLIPGGPQERRQRAGTVNVPGALGFAAAAEALAPMTTVERDRVETVCERLGATILSKGAPRLPNTVSALFDIPGDLLVMALDLEGFALSTGSACSSGAHEDSHVVSALGHTGAPVRVSLGRDSDARDLCAALEVVVPRVRASLA